MKPQILFEDAEILVCHKPAGTAVQTASFSAQDMVSILKNHLALEMRKKETVKGPKTSAPYLAVIHRLDQPVEGILVFGKTKNAAASLTRQLTRNGFKKYYEAMAEGTPPAASGTLTDYLIRDGRTNCSTVCSPDTLGSKKAVLEYQVLAQYETNGKCLSHLRIQLPDGTTRSGFSSPMPDARFSETANITRMESRSAGFISVPVSLTFSIRLPGNYSTLRFSLSFTKNLISHRPHNHMNL